MSQDSFLSPRKPRDTLTSMPCRSMKEALSSSRTFAAIGRGTHNCALAELSSKGFSCWLRLRLDVWVSSDPKKGTKVGSLPGAGKCSDPAQRRRGAQADAFPQMARSPFSSSCTAGPRRPRGPRRLCRRRRSRRQLQHGDPPKAWPRRAPSLRGQGRRSAASAAAAPAARRSASRRELRIRPSRRSRSCCGQSSGKRWWRIRSLGKSSFWKSRHAWRRPASTRASSVLSRNRKKNRQRTAPCRRILPHNVSPAAHGGCFIEADSSLPPQMLLCFVPYCHTGLRRFGATLGDFIRSHRGRN